MYGLNAMAFALFIGINVLSHWLSKCTEKTRVRVLRVFCSLLLFGNIFRYFICYPFLLGEIHIPVEYSTVAYFTVPTVLLLNRKRSRSWAAYSGLMAGFFYYLAMILLGGRIYDSYPPYDIWISMFCHGTLYLCGLVTIRTEACPSRDGYKLALGTALVCVRALILRPYVIGADGLFIYKLLDGDLIWAFLPETSWSVLLPIYYAAAISLVLLSMGIFFRSNRREYDRFSGKQSQMAVIPA